MKKKNTSQPVEFKSVEEVLGLVDDKASEGEETYDLKSLAEDIKVYNFLLNTVNSSMDDYVKAYEKNPSDRSEIETAYTFKIDVLAGMAKVLGPLTSYGRNRLKELKKCSREYESFVAPLVTRITEENIESFSKVLSADLKEDVKVGKLSGLGAVRNKDGEQYGAGAIVYRVDYSPAIDGNVGRILWLYVHEDFRQQGIADHLIAEILGSMQENGIDHITMNCPIGYGQEQDRLNAFLMTSWMFEPETSINPDVLMRVGDIKNTNKVQELGKGVKAVSELKDGVNTNGLKNALIKMGRPGYLTDGLLNSGYIDADLSFYMGTETTMTALLLAHRQASGRIRVEYLNTKDGSFETEQKLISAFFKKVSIKCSEETLLYIPVDSMEIALFIEEICPVQLGQYLLEGLLAAKQASDEDFDVEFADSLTEIKDDELEELNSRIMAGTLE